MEDKNTIHGDEYEHDDIFNYPPRLISSPADAPHYRIKLTLRHRCTFQHPRRAPIGRLRTKYEVDSYNKKRRGVVVSGGINSLDNSDLVRVLGSDHQIELETSLRSFS